MVDPSSIAARVLDALVASGSVTADQVSSARASASSDADAGRSLVDRGLVSSDQLATVLEDELGMPRVDLGSYAPDDDAVALVPGSVARARGVLPMFEIEGMLTVAVGEPIDIFTLDEVGADLGLGMDAVLADASAVRTMITQYYGDEPEIAPVGGAEPDLELEISAADFFDLSEDVPVVPELPAGSLEPVEPAQTVEEVVEAAAPTGTPVVDLDVLAVADERKVAVLVADILEAAVARGASRIHLLPYKNDFFLVFRVKGRLEKIASAPLSMQQPLIDGLKAYAKLGGIAASRPALNRVHADIAGKNVVLTVSSVPTVAGQRLVISIAPSKPQPKGLPDLGMPEAETAALHAMVERGRGILLVCGPVGGGRSTTYYALLNHAAQVGKTVYSVERQIDYEIPAVAQALVSPSQPIGAASYFAAGMRQDTDVMAIDGFQTVEDVHLAIEAASMGKLVIATFAAGDIVAGVRRILDLGVEPVSLAGALTLGVGVRVARTNCPNCSVEERSALTDRIPGAEKGMSSKRGTGCPNCNKTGFAGATGIYEVLPFTEPVRAQIAAAASVGDLAAAAKLAGMRPMIVAGLAKVTDGHVSPEELDRVLRFST